MGARDRIHRPQQLPLNLGSRPSPPKRSSGRTSQSDRSSGRELDVRVSTAEVLRIVGVHRTTLYRWSRAGMFPLKHASGGWLRSDIEQWLAQRAPPPMKVGLVFGDRRRVVAGYA
jgi:predicted DNA-binding transcriptional regulator AlpA